jgi:calcineurin-like phosphoesterase family protein
MKLKTLTQSGSHQIMSNSRILKEGKKVYFSSDNHLGAPTYEASREREITFVKWLDDIKKDAEVIFLLGDLFGLNTKQLFQKDIQGFLVNLQR